MRLVTFEVGTSVGPFQRLGAVLNERSIVDLNFAYVAYATHTVGGERAYEEAAFRVPADMVDHFRGGARGHADAAEALEFASTETAAGKPVSGPRAETVIYDVTDVKLLAPVPRPNSMREFSTYLTHGESDISRAILTKRIADRGEDPDEFFKRLRHQRLHGLPSGYKGNCSAVAGPNDDMYWPRFTERLDPEIELGFYIGREGRDIPKEEAHDYIAAYTMLVDVSARDVPLAPLGPMKEKDFCNLMGPCAVTPDEFDPANAHASFKFDDELIWEGEAGDARNFREAELIEFASISETLYPGDFFSGGTIGHGSAIDTDRWPQPGQVCTFEIAGIGQITSTVIKPDTLPRGTLVELAPKASSA